ncbi:MAG: DoxX protein [Gemmatimonadaceae bacterium]
MTARITPALMLHERWFTSGNFPVRFDLASASRTWIPIGIALGLAVAAAITWRLRGRRDLVPGPLRLGMAWEDYERLLSYMPLVIGVHTAVLLLVSGVELQLFVPNLRLPRNILGGVLALGEIVVALSFIYGAAARGGALLLAGVWLAGLLLFGPLLLLEHALFLGIAFFLLVTGRGALSFDMTLKILHRPFERFVPYGVPVLRILTGVSIVVLAFTEKLWNLPMGLDFLERHNFNFFPALGFDSIGNAEFLLIAGTVELTFGMLLVSGAFLRLTILLLWVPFNLTLPFLGWRELVGHLPMYGVMALILIWGEERPATQGAFVEGVRDKEHRARSAAGDGPKAGVTRGD